MTKPTLLLEVEQALAAANEAQAQLEAFDKANPGVESELFRQIDVQGEIYDALLVGQRRSKQFPLYPEVEDALREAMTKQNERLEPLRKLGSELYDLRMKVFDTGRAYTNASVKWDNSTERWDYLKGLGLASLSKTQE